MSGGETRVRLSGRAIMAANRKTAYFLSQTFPAQDPPCFALSKDSNEGVKHIERKSYCSGFPLFKTS